MMFMPKFRFSFGDILNLVIISRIMTFSLFKIFIKVGQADVIKLEELYNIDKVFHVNPLNMSLHSEFLLYLLLTDPCHFKTKLNFAHIKYHQKFILGRSLKFSSSLLKKSKFSHSLLQTLLKNKNLILAYII